jgi:hypothetical protein
MGTVGIENAGWRLNTSSSSNNEEGTLSLPDGPFPQFSFFLLNI